MTTKSNEYEPRHGQSERSAAERQQRVVIWLCKQWRQSFAKSIWDDLTPFGRATIWVPIWLTCWACLPILLPVMAIFTGIERLTRNMPKMPPIFFTR